MPLTGEVPVLANIINDIGLETRSLEPKDNLHQNLLAACIEQYRNLVQARWKVIEGVRGSITPAFYWVLAFWLALLFGTFCLTAPAEPDGRDGDRSMRAVDHRHRFRDPRYGRTLWRPVRRPKHVDAQRALRHDAVRPRVAQRRVAAHRMRLLWPFQ